jgi:hypothetical protein
MKMKAKKGGVFAALTAALFIMAALITSCPESLSLGGFTVPQGKGQTPFAPPEGTTVSQPPEEKTVFQMPEGSTVFQTPEGNSVFQTPEGDIVFQLPEEELAIELPVEVGYLQLSISTKDGGARTIMPDTSAVTTLANFTNFDIYVLNGTTDVAGSATKGVSPNSSGVFPSIAVAPVESPGTYTVQVFGNFGGTAVAFGSASSGAIAASATANVSIGLTEIVDGEGDGTFAWDITPAANSPAAAVSMNILAIGGGAVAKNVGALTLTGTPGSQKYTDSTTLPSGYYRVEIEQTRTNYKTVKTISSLHVYQGFTSTFDSYTLPDLKRTVYVVTYNWNDGLEDESELADPVMPVVFTTQSVNHAGAITRPATNPTPRAANLVFDDWYLLPTSTTAFPFASTYKLLNDLTLNAKWTTITTGNIVVTVTGVTYPNPTALEPNPTLSGTTVSQTGAQITITLANAVTADYDSYYWLDESGTRVDDYDDDDFIFDTAEDGDGNNILGIYTIFVVAVKGGQEYTNEVRITVTLP